MTAGNSQTVTFTINEGSQNQTLTSQATFNVSGPTGVEVSTSLGQWQILSMNNTPGLGFGFPISTPGIQLNGSATSPSNDAGSYQWAQIGDTNTLARTSGSGTTTCSTGTGLDNSFPTDTGMGYSDSPAMTLQSSYSRETWSLGFTTYFMWRPGLANDIPVPLGYVEWQAYGDAEQNNGSWVVQSDSSQSAGAFQASSSFPTWTSVVTNGSNPCH